MEIKKEINVFKVKFIPIKIKDPPKANGVISEIDITVKCIDFNDVSILANNLIEQLNNSYEEYEIKSIEGLGTTYV